ncbi:MAG: response regulator transcription factor [Candidatus Eisenbacteria bacterium]|uniref:Response regulator transcription factor n=1 Tax=Eiseniibacteriota bacterium TaxID=2212470 RepID=A0A538SW05_UNCEI|nr:MAG: response regulator transcription factor [Candidatus Eisenbacteria bacterium]
MSTRVLIADDHALFRDGLKALLVAGEFEIVAEVENGQDAIREARRLHPDVAIVDIGMPGLNGVDAAREVLRVSPGTKVIVLTMHKDHIYIAESLRAGARGYVLKSRGAKELLEALREIVRGGIYLSPGLSQEVVESFLRGDKPPESPLSPREREVLQLVAEGKTTKEVAATLFISFKTVESHRQRIMSKLDLHETASLVRYAIRSGLIQP